VGQHLALQALAHLAGGDMDLPRLHIRAGRRARGDVENLLHQGAGHRIGPERTHGAALAQGLVDMHVTLLNPRRALPAV